MEDIADKLEDKVNDAKDNVDEVCSGPDSFTVDCITAKEDLEKAENDFAAASQAADDAASTKGNGGKVAGAIIGVLLVIALVVAFLLYRQKNPTHESIGEVQKKAHAQSFENPTYDQVSGGDLEGGTAINARGAGSIANTTYDYGEEGIVYDNATGAGAAATDAAMYYAAAAGASAAGASGATQMYKVPYDDNVEQTYDAAAAGDGSDTYGDLPAIPTTGDGEAAPHMDSEA